ncbi:hypothetical protein MVEG_11660 [Podila verticillata NRRL 6337]|uniref:NAD(P)-binding domain-containing protein n=1 Tax=Podila verticillata NRRL 6337 TaxID=1069443 RepID=A0A086TKH4_9FUNG|nr:hypothetical protein MVEG_11660 [Podila verticillata NRRL 6337]
MTASSDFIAFFGATGGCTNAALVHTLNAAIHVRALARTPSKLTDMLLAQGISQATIDSQLTIIKGDIASMPAIKSVLLSDKDHTLASQIMSGVGGTPQLRWSIKRPVTIDNPEICATTTKNIVQALHEIYAEHPSTATHKPSIVIISTTGVSDVREDVPFGFQTMYHVALADPHKDKKVMEKIITENAAGSDAVFRGAIAVRPSLLTGDQNIKGGKGWKSLRVGQEDKPAIGYTIHKADVGEWIFEETIKTDGQRWFGQKVTLTN